MKIIALKSFVSCGCTEYKKDKQYDISENLAKMFIENKLVVAVKEETNKTENKKTEKSIKNENKQVKNK